MRGFPRIFVISIELWKNPKLNVFRKYQQEKNICWRAFLANHFELEFP